MLWLQTGLPVGLGSTLGVSAAHLQQWQSRPLAYFACGTAPELGGAASATVILNVKALGLPDGVSVCGTVLTAARAAGLDLQIRIGSLLLL